MKESNFYDPIQIPENNKDDKTHQLIDIINSCFKHASANELKNMMKSKIKELEGLNVKHIESCYNDRGNFCSGCAEGKLKELARLRSMRPLLAQGWRYNSW
jgi:hypothetical protein